METKRIFETCPEYDNPHSIIKQVFWNRIIFAFKFSETRTKKAGVVLDIGCGRAKLFELFNKTGHNIDLVGIDIEKDVTKLKIKNARFIAVTAGSALPFKDHYFDEIFALDCLEHIENLDFQIDEIKRVVKTGGSFIVSGPTENLIYKIGRFIMKGSWNEVYNQGEVHKWDIHQVTQQILAKGFKIKESKRLPFKLLPLFLVYKFVKEETL